MNKPSYSYQEVVGLIELSDKCTTTRERSFMLAIIASAVVTDSHLYLFDEMKKIVYMIDDRQKGIIKFR